MEHYICIHGHFYQPPRENPWLRAIEQQESAYPYHDWNERINAECYASNAASRILNEHHQTIKMINNYEKISFNFGPTLLSWLEEKSPDVYAAILEADKESRRQQEGHGNAIAQAYNHAILPLCNSRDKYTQILWGIRDFLHRFERQPEGLWLPETAVDLESLSILAEQGIRFIILAQRQAKCFRKIGTIAWQEVYDGQIDPTMPYLLNLPNGRSIAVFFSDGVVAHAVAFGDVLNQGENFSNRLIHIFSDKRNRIQLASIATDGETYGHHHPNGNMALTYALEQIENNYWAKITNYGYFLEKYPPIYEIEILENTSWSCIHGIERWRSACGCCNEQQPGWNQQWRRPLRVAFDWLRDQLAPLYEEKAKLLLKDPWQARNDYIDIILTHSPQVLEDFWQNQATHPLNETERRQALGLLEMQRHAMLMYTSCGWFFDELSGIETVQVISYAARTVQFAENFLETSIEKSFCEKLAEAASNLKHIKDGRMIYEKIKPNKCLNGRQRIVIEQVSPEIDGGRFPIKRCINETITVEAVIFADGHSPLNAQLKYRHANQTEWQTIPFQALSNDRWQATFTVSELGDYLYTLSASVEDAHYDYTKELKVTVDRERARFGSWYEVFPRSLVAPHHGTFRDLIAHLPYIASMGFDVLYLPPIHPIGRTHRKGKNNATETQSNDPGSPWGIGSAEGGHTDIHPQLGHLADFQALLTEAKNHHLEIALDLALQCAPDHPYVTKHPQWFKHRPDGSIQYAENPPKKYQDIYPLDFQSDQWMELWEECRNIVLFWIKAGVRIFRVDNPHTKPFLFWEWLISKIKSDYPEVLFLSEAFTRPHLMYYLSKAGFSQSYTYFTWRNTKKELTDYMNELTHTIVREFFRPHFWTNTPDILPAYLQTSGRPGFIIRLILAATLGSNYGIYGPAFELCESAAKEPNSEEYLNSEKYEIKAWNLTDPIHIREIITRVNQIRRENSCLQSNDHLFFHAVDNEQLLSYSKGLHYRDLLLIIINLDPHHQQSGWLETPIESWGLSENREYIAHDLLNGAQYTWCGRRNYVELNPEKSPAHIFRIEESSL
jgi:alpha-amylase/alpha-mannosidase (GH57 family)